MPRAIAAATASFLSAAAAASAIAQGDAPPCGDDGPTQQAPVCRIADGIDGLAASRLLGEETAYYALDGDVVTIALRAEGEPFVCCSIQPRLTEHAPGLFADRFRLLNAARARLQFYDGETDTTLFGPHARPSPEAMPLRGAVREESMESDALGERRRYSVYTPSAFDATRRYPVVIFSDGWGLADKMTKIEPRFADGSIRPFVGIGVPSGADAIVTDAPDAYGYDVRAADYLPFMFEDGEPGAGRFAAHLSFVLDELLPHVLSELSLSDPPAVIVVGYSNGGAFAAEAALRRQDVLTGAIAMSEAGRGGAGSRPVPDLIGDGPILLFSGGLYERAFGEKGRRSARVLGEAGYRTRYCEYAGGHDSLQWDLALADGLASLLSAQNDEDALAACPRPLGD